MHISQIEKDISFILQEIFAELKSPFSYGKLNRTASFQHDYGMDSLTNAEFFQRIEKQFEIRLSDSIMSEVDSIKELAEAINTVSPIQVQPSTSSIPEHSRSQNPLKLELEETLCDVLMRYAELSPHQSHINIEVDGHNEIITYEKLYHNAKRVAQKLVKQGLQPGDTVAIMLPTCSQFFYSFFGILLAKCIPVPIYPPLKIQQIESYINKEVTILKNAQIKLLITFNQAKQVAKILNTLIPTLKKVVTADILIHGEDEVSFTCPHYSSKDIALIQYTSGSTGNPKGVSLSHNNLIANIRAFGKAIGISQTDIVLSWLPLYHDLGLIAIWLGSLYYGLPLYILSPISFLNRPEKWLLAAHQSRATIIAAPNFAYDLCVNKIDAALLKNCDLSSIRLAINGAETVQSETMKRFTQKFSPFGFKLEAFLPVYGLAESTVGLTASPLGRIPLVDIVDRDIFELEQRAVSATKKEAGLEFVSCGPPLPGHEIRIVDSEGHELEECCIGKLQFKGPSSMQGYYRNDEATQAIFHDGWLDSGDLGYKKNSEVYITGRHKDVIIKAGRNIQPSEIEKLTSEIVGIRKGCVIAFGVLEGRLGTEKLIIVAETNEKNPQYLITLKEEISKKIFSCIMAMPDEIILLPPRTIPKTSSGKLQRLSCKNSYMNGSLSKKSSSLVAQFTRLTAFILKEKTKKIFSKIVISIYSIYIASVSIVTLFPVFLLMFFVSSQQARVLLKAWAILIRYLSFLPMQVIGKNHINKSQPTLYVANHTSYLDAVALLNVLPSNTLFLSKKEILKVPVLGNLTRKIGSIFVDRFNMSDSIESMEAITKNLEAGRSIVIFSEGSLKDTPGVRPFKMGAFKLASLNNIPICPIALKGLRQVFPKNHFLMKYSPITVTICSYVKAKGTEWMDVIDLKEFVRNKIVTFSGEGKLDFVSSS